MKLFEAGFVLLIIGAAVIGPIESKKYTQQELQQWVDDGQPLVCGEGSGWRKMPNGSFVLGGSCLPPRRETTAETCVRAMREIGLGPVLMESRRGAKHRAWYGPNGNYAYCIPAPSGLKR